MAEQLKNSLDNPTSTLASAIASGALSLTVAAGHGSRFPASGDFRVKLTVSDDDTLYELVICTSRSTDTLTVTRAAEGTTARAFSAADLVDLVLTEDGLETWANERYWPLATDLATQVELDAHTSDTADAHDASAISILDAANDFTATDVEGALAELQSDHETDATNLSDHIADASAAHAASAISADSTTLVGTGTTVQAVFEELDNGIADHLADSSAAHAASAISNAPAGSIAATTVQAAIDELAGDVGSLPDLSVILAPATDARNVIQPTDATVIPLTLKGAAAQSDSLLVVEDYAGTDLVTAGPTGAVTISPSDVDIALVAITAAGATGPVAELRSADAGVIAGIGGSWSMWLNTLDGNDLLAAFGGDPSGAFFEVSPTGAVTISPGAAVSGLTVKDSAAATTLEANDTGLGFFGATPAAKPTGVAVTAEAIHAALVTLGLIAA